MDKELLDRLNTLKTEDYIWIVLIGLILLSFYANNIEREYLITKNKISKQRYRHITIFIFSIALIVYLYYTNDSKKTYQKLKPTDSIKKRTNVTLSYLSSLLIATSGIILVLIAITDTELEIELAYN